VESIARILLLLLLAALVLAYLKGGMPGVQQWLHLKFVGEGGH
jgi:hypothetical protein